MSFNFGGYVEPDHPLLTFNLSNFLHPTTFRPTGNLRVWPRCCIFALRKLTEGTEVPSFYYMAQTTATHHLESLIRSVFEEGRCGEYYLVDLEVGPSGHIIVYVDGDEGVSLDACTQISRILESVLDQEPSLGGVYQLEVSSPGVTRSLKFPRQYLKHVGRTLRIELWNGEKVEGQLTNTGHEAITLEIKSGDKKIKPVTRDIPYEEIKEAFVTIQFGKTKN